MTLLIDGYNVLYEVGILPRRAGPGQLERARLALANILAYSLPTRQLARTIVVFDARGAPAGLPREVMHRGLLLRFADPGCEADELIENLIRTDSAPRRLLVVSSDHRLQKAAKRRGGSAVDSGLWFKRLVARRRSHGKTDRPEPDAKPLPCAADLAAWLQFFGETVPANDSDSDAATPPSASNRSSSSPTSKHEAPRATDSFGPSARSRRACKKRRRSSANRPPDLPEKEIPSPNDFDVFPPGYAEDVFDEEL